MERLRAVAALVAALILAHFLLVGIAFAEEGRKTIVLIFDGIGLEDLNQTQPPNIMRLIRRGGVALMNTRSARAGDGASGYLTIGAGASADAGSKMEAGLAFNGDRDYEGRTAAEVYDSQNEQKASGESVVVLTAPFLRRRNAEENFGARPGLLGEALRGANKKASVAGNSDYSTKHRREAALIAMDESGLVAEGRVERDLQVQDGSSPFGVRTDYDRLLQASLNLLDRSDLLVVELGDTSRVNAYADFLTEEALVSMRREALLRGDEFLGGLLRARKGRGDLVVMVSPNPPVSSKEMPGRLTPLVVAGPGFGSGLLLSPTTRSAGLVTNTDIAPTVLRFLNVPVPEDMSGRGMMVVRNDSPVDFLLARDNRILATAEQRKPILTFYVAVVFVLLVLGTLSLALPPAAKPVGAIQFLLVWSLAVPFSLLLLPLLPVSSLGVSAVAVAAISGLATAVCWTVTRDFLRTLAAIALSTVALISADVVLGAPLMKSSLLGYDPLIGARFYGIGNEYMGVLIGSALIGSCILLDSFPGKTKVLLPLTGIIFLFLILLIGHPQLGANTGGTIAAAAAFLFAAARLRQRRISLKTTLLIGAMVILVVSLFVAGDYFNSIGNQSHIGKAASLIRKEGAKSAFEIIQRKLAMNLKLIQWTIWSKVLVVSLLIFALIFAKPIGIFKKIDAKHPHITNGIHAIIAGSIVALVFNDSGVVAAATMIIFGVVALLHLAMERERTII